jgi:hypothetical protein
MKDFLNNEEVLRHGMTIAVAANKPNAKTSQLLEVQRLH